jgi:uncharacterized protein with LGFP repeats
MLRRAVLALAAASVVVALAPCAAASPESDADDAITAAWKAGGGADSRLGPKQGDVYAVGDGFVQDFAGGKMFFTPATGARSLYGPILDNYESLGGPVGSDLGFPTITEVPGLAGPDTLVSTFAASDKPVIFWSAAHGAFVVRGAMNAAWDKLGSSGGVLGVPVNDETYNGELSTQSFTGGQLSWNRLTKVFTTVPPELAQQLTGLQVPIDPTAAIDTAWRSAGGAAGPLGAKQGGQYPVGNNAIAQKFAGGKVFFSPGTGANAMESDILSKYESLGGPGSDLGLPTANETDGGIKPTSRISRFSAADKPVIFWTPAHGAFVVRAAMKAAWDKLGGAKGTLGAPVGDQAVDGDVVSQKFTGGKISWNRAKNAYTTEPPNLASSLSGLQVPGQKPPSRTAAPAGTARTWHWSWLLVAIPVLLLVGLLAMATLWARRRRMDGRRAAARRRREARAARPYEPVPLRDDRWSAEADSDVGLSGFGAGYPEAPEPTPPMAEPDRPAAPESWRLTPEQAEARSIDAEQVGAAPPDVDEDIGVEDPDKVDTAPTRIPSEAELRSQPEVSPEPAVSPEAAVSPEPAVSPEGEVRPEPAATSEPEVSPEPEVSREAEVRPQAEAIPEPVVRTGGRHAAAETSDDEDVWPGAANAVGPAIHLPLEDPREAPEGYPVKGNASFGLYYTPDSALYDDAFAEIWFASEEVARANGFTKAG